MTRNLAAALLALITAGHVLGQQDPSQPRTAERPGASGGAVTVTLLEPGTEPRRTLRYGPHVGDRFELVMSMTMDVHQKVGGHVTPYTPTPEMVMTMRASVASISAAGEIRVEYTVTDSAAKPRPGGNDQVTAKAGEALHGLVGATGYGLLTSRGEVLGADFKVPDGTSPLIVQAVAGMKQSMSQLAAPLPEEPVGTGARWKVAAHPTLQGIATDQTMTFGLERSEGDEIALQVSIEQQAAPQDVHNPLLPAGTRLHVKSSEVTGTGSNHISLRRAFPDTAAVTAHASQHMLFTVDGEEQELEQTIDVRMGLKCKPLEADQDQKSEPTGADGK